MGEKIHVAEHMVTITSTREDPVELQNFDAGDEGSVEKISVCTLLPICFVDQGEISEESVTHCKRTVASRAASRIVDDILSIYFLIHERVGM